MTLRRQGPGGGRSGYRELVGRKGIAMDSTRTPSARSPFRHHLLDRPAVRAAGRAPFLLSAGLGLATLAAAVPSLLFPDLLTGEAVLEGNLRGTAVVMLALGLPLLVLGLVRSAHNSVRWLVVWLGAVAYLTYQGPMFLFGTPFNSLFLTYVALLGFGIWTSVVLLHDVQLRGFEARTDARMPVRTIGGVLVTIVSLNAAAWLVRIIPTIGSDRPTSVLDGSGLLTSPGWVQDLAFWIPASLVAGVLMWRRRPRGVLLAGALLVFFTIESLSVASDQWWGVRADDSQPDWASMTAVPMFLVLAVVTALPLVWYFRNLDRH